MKNKDLESRKILKYYWFSKLNGMYHGNKDICGGWGTGPYL
jgi:hypothetical protein